MNEAFELDTLNTKAIENKGKVASDKKVRKWLEQIKGPIKQDSGEFLDDENLGNSAMTK